MSCAARFSRMRSYRACLARRTCDRDGNVVLDEAYQYAYENTLRASSRSASGLQHPTFFYDMRGQGQLVLTRPFANREHRGVVELPSGAAFLIFRSGPDGQVMAEVSALEPSRSLSLAPGAYFLRGRTDTHVLEGTIQVEAAAATRVDPDDLTRIEYAHLVRKGYASLPRTHAVELLARGARFRRCPTPTHLGYGALELPAFDTAYVRAWLLAFCRLLQQWARSGDLDSHTNEYDLSLRVLHAFDLSTRFSLDVGVSLGTAYLEQMLRDAGQRAHPPNLSRRRRAHQQPELRGDSTAYTRRSALALASYVLPMLDTKTRESQLSRRAHRSTRPGRRHAILRIGE